MIMPLSHLGCNFPIICCMSDTRYFYKERQKAASFFHSDAGGLIEVVTVGSCVGKQKYRRATQVKEKVTAVSVFATVCVYVCMYVCFSVYCVSLCVFCVYVCLIV